MRLTLTLIALTALTTLAACGGGIPIVPII